MCEICRQTPCHNMCPNAEEQPVVGTCSVCGDDIYAGEYFFEITEDKRVHKSCAGDLVPEELFDLWGIDIHHPMRQSDIDAEKMLNAFGLYQTEVN